MFKKLPYIRIGVVSVLFLSAHMAFAAFTGSVDSKDNNNKFSLKNLNKISKNYSLSSLSALKNSYEFKNQYQLNEQKTDDNAVEIQSMVRLEKGNTTFVYPYKYKVKVPKFKTPVPPAASH